jgi:hypothetical protein
MSRWLCKNRGKKSNAKTAQDNELDGLMAQAEAIFNNADSVLAGFEQQAVLA